MQDMIIRQTGNSRTLKSVGDFLTRYPTYQDFANALAAGTLPVDFNGLNHEGIAQAGTPLSKANLLSDATAAKFFTSKIADHPVGSVARLREDGVLTDFIIAKHDYESGLNGTGRTLLVRKYAAEHMIFSNANDYAASNLDAWFNGDYFQMLDPSVRAQIGTTEFYYTPGDGNHTVTTLKRPVFTLSATEYGYARDDVNVEGSALSLPFPLITVTSLGRVIWTRSPNIAKTNHAWAAGQTAYTLDVDSSELGARPAFTLPSSLHILSDGTLAAEAPDYTPDDVFGKIASSLVSTNKVEIIGYTGTGGDGTHSNAITFTFRNKPLYVIVMSQKAVFSNVHYLAFLPVFSWNTRSSNDSTANGSSAWFGLEIRTSGEDYPRIFPYVKDQPRDTNGNIVDNTVSFWRRHGDTNGRYSMNLASIKYIAIGFCEA